VHGLPEAHTRRIWSYSKFFPDFLPLVSKASHGKHGEIPLAKEWAQLLKVQPKVDSDDPIPIEDWGGDFVKISAGADTFNPSKLAKPPME
jgi:hypothetical protein